MRDVREYLRIGGLFVGLAALAACGPTTTTMATNTPRAATATPAAAVTPTDTQAVTGSPAVQTTPPPAVSPTVRGTPAIAGTPATPATPAVARLAEPEEVYRNLQALGNYRLTLNLSGFAVAGTRSDDVTVVYEYNQDAVYGRVISGGTQVFEAYRIGDRLYVTNPATGGFVETDPGNPLAQPAQAFFGLPETILTTLTPATANYQATATETVNGRQATRYVDTIEIANLGFIDPSLQGQRGTAETTLWITTLPGAASPAVGGTPSPAVRGTGNVLVAADAVFRTAAGGDPVARLRLDVTDIGQVDPITPPR